MKRKIHALAVADRDLATGDITQVARVFDQVVASARYSKTLRGRVVFAFGRHAQGARHNFEVEEVRRYTQAIDARYPFFPYFLPADPDLGEVFAWIASLTPLLDPEPGEVFAAVNPHELVQAAALRVRAVRDFCAVIGDDPAGPVEAIVKAMPDEIVDLVKQQIGNGGSGEAGRP
jgi:hypothetical protein